MPEGISAAAKWLNNEDVQRFEDRLSRLEWLVNESPTAEYWIFAGGILAKRLFEEARYSFVYAQFLATTLLGLAYIEQTLAALFYEAGRNDLQRAGLSKLLSEAHAHGLIMISNFRTWREFAKSATSMLTSAGQDMRTLWNTGQFMKTNHHTVSSNRTLSLSWR